MNEIFLDAVNRFSAVERHLEGKGIDLSHYEIMRLLLESNKIQVLSIALLGEFNPDDIDEPNEFKYTPIHKIANALYLENDGEPQTGAISVLRELFELNHNISKLSQ